MPHGFFVSPGATGKQESTSESDADGEKVRRHAAKFGYDLWAIYADLKKLEAEHIAVGHPYIPPPERLVPDTLLQRSRFAHR